MLEQSFGSNAKVVHVGHEAIDPRHRIVTPKMRLCLPNRLQEPLHVCIFEMTRVAAFLEFQRRVLPRGLEKLVAAAGPRLIGHERLVDQLGEHVEDVVPVERFVSGHRFSCGK